MKLLLILIALFIISSCTTAKKRNVTNRNRPSTEFLRDK
jgi:hypothetical protein